MRDLTASFAALYRYVNRREVARRIVVALLAIHTSLLAYSAYVHSPTLNEPAHLVAGLSHWKFGRFELYRVNPPLVRMVAALPVMAAGYEEDWSGFYEGPGTRPVFAMGEDFIAANGERSFFLFMIARWACIPFSWIGAIVCYLWARDLFGRPSGLMACAIWCFEPNILAHASLITPDAHAAALGAAACYTFWRWLRKPSWSQAALTGVVLGLAELAKTTLILFYPLWPLLWLVYRWSDRHGMDVRHWIREAGMLLLRMAIGLYVLNLGYGFEGTLRPLGEFEFVSDLLSGDEAASSANGPNRFSGTWLAPVPVPFPQHYVLGIDIQQKDFENYGRPSYLRGEWQDHGWWYYYLYAALIKVPLGLWCLGVLGTILAIRGIIPAPRRDVLVLLAPAVFVFCVVSSKTGFSEHFRYVLPVFPLLFVWIGGCAGSIFFKSARCRFETRGGFAKIPTKTRMAPCLLAGLFAWHAASSLWVYPHSLSYFNESIGGPRNGAEHLLGSNLDWGQDVRYIRDWVCANQHILHAQSTRMYCRRSTAVASAVGFDASWFMNRSQSSVQYRRRCHGGTAGAIISKNFLYSERGDLATLRSGELAAVVDQIRHNRRERLHLADIAYSTSVFELRKLPNEISE